MSKRKRQIERGRDEDETEEMVLVPRVRLDITVLRLSKRQPKPVEGGANWETRMARSISAAVVSEIGWEPKVCDSDIHLSRIHPPFNIGPGRRWKVATGTVFFRDFNFIFFDDEDGYDNDDVTEERLQKTRQYLLDHFSPLPVSVVSEHHTHTYEIWGSIPPSEDADQMMSFVPPSRAFSGSRYEPSTIIISGVPCKWFVEQPYSKPSKQLLCNFFSTFGEVRDIDTSENNENETCCNILVQYDNYKECYKALKKLCSFSLQKKGNSRTHQKRKERKGNSMADYIVAWKDIEVSFSHDKRSCESFLGWPSKRAPRDLPSPPPMVRVSHNPPDPGVVFKEKYAMLKSEKSRLEEKLNVVVAKLKTVKPSRSLYI